jgi:hypothetical protein
MPDLLPKIYTVRTPNRTKDIILTQALGMILSERSQQGECYYEIDEDELVFSVRFIGGGFYSLFLHNSFLSEAFPKDYYFVSNVEMNREEFLDFVNKIKERAVNTMIRWDQAPKIISNEEGGN